MSHLTWQRALQTVKGLPLRVRCLLGLWGFFFLLVLTGVHGSSVARLADWWSPTQPSTGYLFDLPNWLREAAPFGLEDNTDDLFMRKARWVRWDELLVFTPWSLSQLSHQPRFPVINENNGVGQNMLASQSVSVPVWHVATIARPATWGYFVFGAQRGLAWYWWFRVFACFAALYLLLEVILKGHRGLAAFGAFWFCGSAYVVCWSLFPSHLIFYAALACLSAYYLLAAEKRSTQIINGILLGVSLPGFAMFLYPAWQVPLVYLFSTIFLCLFIRDRLYLSFRPLPMSRLAAILAALVLAGGILISYYVTCADALRAMAETAYPGRRFSLGGNHPFPLIFKGMYNLLSIYELVPYLGNESESSSFYYLFPIVFLAACASKRVRDKLGIVGWALIFYILAMALYSTVGVPRVVAQVTLMSYVPAHRVDIGVGPAAIILTMQALAMAGDAVATGGRLMAKTWSLGVSLLTGLFFFSHGLILRSASGGFPSFVMIFVVTFAAGFLAYTLLEGMRKAFCVTLGAIVALTTAFFNPLSTNLDHLYESELARQILKLNRQAGTPPRWVCYGSGHPSVLVNVLDGKTIAGIQWPPQLSLWRAFDPQGLHEEKYNRYTEVVLSPKRNVGDVAFSNPAASALDVRVPPINNVFRALGAKYVLAMGNSQKELDTTGLLPVYRAPGGTLRFSKSLNEALVSLFGLCYKPHSKSEHTADRGGNGNMTVGVHRPGDAVFLLRNSNQPGDPDLVVAPGLPMDKPVVGNWDGK